MVTEVVGMRDHEFDTEDNSVVKGTFIYLKITMSDDRVETRRVFVSEDRLAEFAHIPKVGDKVLVFASNGKIVDFLKA